MEFKGKTVWITGASSGIGEALAKAFSQNGAAVILSGRRVAALEKTAAAIGGKTLVLPFEATDFDALPDAVKTALQWRGGVDILVNNAGVSQRSLAVDTDFDVYRRIMEVDFFAPVRLTQLVLPSMVERHSGAIVVISSVAGKIGAPLRTAYCAAKHALFGFYDALRTEVEKAYGIGVHLVAPGSVRTNVAVNALEGDGARRGRSDENIDNGMLPEKAAEIILAGLQGGRREILVAEGIEAAVVSMRAETPDKLFDLLAGEGERLAAARASGKGQDPSRISSLAKE